MQSQGRDWRLILLSISAGGAAVMAFGLVITILTYALVRFVPPDGTARASSLLEALVLSSAVTLIGILLLPAAFHGLRRLLGGPATLISLPVFNFPLAIILAVAWFGLAGLSQIFFNNPLLRWFSPPLYLLAIGLPVYGFYRLSAGGLLNASKPRAWGVFSSGMLLGPILAGLGEVTLVGMGILLATVYVAFHPELRETFRTLGSQIRLASSADDLLKALGPFMLSPMAIGIALLFLSGLAPLLEESAKSLSVWLLFDRLETSAQGFAIGALSGAGFGLVESLLASITPDASWGVTLAVRGASSMMHIFAASLTGLAIANFRLNRKVGRLISMYAAAIGLHSVWNGAAIFVTFGALRAAGDAQKPDLLGVLMAFLGFFTLAVLSLGIPLAIILMNAGLRKAIPASAAPAAIESTQGVQ